MKPWILSLGLLVIAGAASAQEAPAGDAVRGKATYLRNGCAQCHGTTGAGGGWQGPKLAPDPMPWDGFLGQLREPADKMPPYRAAVLTDAQAADIHAYLRGIPKGRSADQIDILKR